jgi:ubiquinone/menaquinone biosynthesis C-methylase UbiE
MRVAWCHAYKGRMSMPDWSLGSFEDIAPALHPASQHVIAAARPRPGEYLVDVGCGTGTAALLAAQPGVMVTGVDPAPRLLEIARAAAVERDLEVSFVPGDAAAMPMPDGSADIVVSVFGVIFAADPAEAAAEFRRVLAPTGRIVLTAWLPEGRLNEITAVFLSAAFEGEAGPPRFEWHSTEHVAALLGEEFEVSAERHELAFVADSEDEYWSSHILKHPLMQALVPVLEERDALQATYEKARVVLSEVNEDPPAFRLTAPYVVITAQRRTA